VRDEDDELFLVDKAMVKHAIRTALADAPVFGEDLESWLTSVVPGLLALRAHREAIGELERTDIERAADALAQAITSACVMNGGSCNWTIDGLLSVNATISPAVVIEAVLEAVKAGDGGPVPSNLKGRLCDFP